MTSQTPAVTTPARSSRSSGRMLAAALFLLAGISALLVALMVAGYLVLARDLPSADTLAARTATFRSTRILDREGQLLNETFNPEAGRRTVVPLAEISPLLVQATIATEDANFYRHRGVDPVAIARAVWYALQEREIVSGASTIPQQLVKQAFLSSERSVSRKVKEAVLAAEISRRYSKDQILELYLNEIFYGNLAYGAEAAAETYFGKDVAQLSLPEAALLAGLPQAPAYYDPYTQPERALRRRGTVLALMAAAGAISVEEAEAARQAPLELVPLRFDLRAPHFTLLVREQIEAAWGPDALYKLGLEVTTTLDGGLQAEAERIVAEQVGRLADRDVGNGALVALRPGSGELLALVGSADFNKAEISGQVNMATAPRQPGSALKPFVYLATFEQPEQPREARWTPGTLVADIRTEFPDGANPPYVPLNYDEREHGMVTVRAALANSYNIPAVKALETAGLPAMVALARRLGITTLTRPDYGLSLALGGGEVPLLELTGAYAALAAGGERHPPIAILKVVDGAGQVLCEAADPARPCPPAEPGGEDRRRVIDPVDAFLVTDILRDNEARIPAFGPGSALELDRPAAVKTGTTNDFRDNLTLGYTPQLVTGVWVGNADNRPMRGVSGVTGAGPIWNAFMRAALAEEPVLDFDPPPGVAPFEVCRDTGSLPSPACPERRRWWFAEDRPPLPPERDLWQRLRLDRETGRLADAGTPADRILEQVFKIYPEAYRAWAEANGIPQPPPGFDQTPEIPVAVRIEAPASGARVWGSVAVLGNASLPGFASYRLTVAPGRDAEEPGQVIGAGDRPVAAGLLGVWQSQGQEPGSYTLRLTVFDAQGRAFEDRINLRLEPPEASATASATSSAAPPSPSPTTALAPSATPPATLPASPPPPTLAPNPTPALKPSPPPATLAPRPTLLPPSPEPSPAPSIEPSPEPSGEPGGTETPEG